MLVFSFLRIYDTRHLDNYTNSFYYKQLNDLYKLYIYDTNLLSIRNISNSNISYIILLILILQFNKNIFDRRLQILHRSPV